MEDESAKLSEHLEAVARLMELDDENPHKVRAFLTASVQVRGRTRNELDAPMRIPGVGPSIAGTIKEFLTRGTSSRLQLLSERWPVEILSLLRVQGIGPKRARDFFEQGVHSFEELVEKAKSGALDPKLTERVMVAHSQGKRIPIEIAMSIASEIKRTLLRSGATRVQVCGSIRRHVPTCKDIDIVVQSLSDDPSAVRRTFEQLGKVLWSGPSKSSIMLLDGSQQVQCDMWIVNDWNWGSALNYTTGSKAHNQRLRGLLKSRGMRMNEYGIYMPADGIDLDGLKVSYGPEHATCGDQIVAKRIGGSDEGDVYKILGVSYVQPSQRVE